MKHDFTKYQCLSLEEIKAYLNEEISEQEKTAFNQHFATCTLCQEVKESYPSIDEQVLAADLLSINAAIATKFKPSEAVNRRLFISRIAAGLSLLLTGSASLFYWNATKPNRLYNSYFKPYDIAEVVTRGERSGITEYNFVDIPKALKLATENYHAGKFKESLPYFEEVLKQQPQNTYAAFLNAVANLKENNTDKAIDQLKDVLFNDPKYYEDANWYLALAFLKKSNKTEALFYLEKVEQIKDGFYKEEAMALRKKL